MQSVSDMYSSRNVLVLLCAGALALVPVLLRRVRRTDRSTRHRTPAPVASLLPIIAHGAGGAAAAASARSPAAAVASVAAAAQKRISLPSALALSPPGQRRLEDRHEN